MFMGHICRTTIVYYKLGNHFLRMIFFQNFHLKPGCIIISNTRWQNHPKNLILKMGGPKYIDALMTRFLKIGNIYYIISSSAYAPNAFSVYELSYSRNDSFRCDIGIICHRGPHILKMNQNLDKMLRKVQKLPLIHI